MICLCGIISETNYRSVQEVDCGTSLFKERAKESKSKKESINTNDMCLYEDGYNKANGHLSNLKKITTTHNPIS